MSALCAVSVLMLAAAAPAQGTDDDGVLPSAGQPGNTSHSGGGGSSINATAGTTVGVTGATDADQLTPEQACITLSSVVGDTDLQTGADPSEATFTAESSSLTVEQTQQGVSLQGRGMLTLNGNLSAVFRAPDDAVLGALVLVLDHGTESLDDVKSGGTVPLAMAIVGDLSTMDLSNFQAVVEHHAEDLPGISATLIFVSRDSSGVLHTSAVRAATSGGPIEVVIE